MDEEDSEREGDDESVDEMFKHLDGAKERYKENKQKARRRKASSLTPLQQAMRSRTDGAVLASNHEARLKEIEENDAVTHRSGKPWTTAKIGVDAHGTVPIYYRQDGLVTHTAYITDIVVNPSKNSNRAKRFVEHVTDDDTYDQYHDQLDTTTFIVSEGRQLDDPFPQSELELLSGDGTISEEYSRQPAYVVQRPGDFPKTS